MYKNVDFEVIQNVNKNCQNSNERKYSTLFELATSK